MIDIHTHLHPPRLFKAIRRWFAENSSWNLQHPTEPAVVADSLRAHGVERFVFCSYAHKPGIARDINSWLTTTSHELGRFGLPLATVHPSDPDCVSYYEEALENGCIGLKIHEDVQRIAIDDPRLYPIHELTAAHNGFILVHVGPIPWTTDTNNGPARIKQVLDRHKQLNVVVAHMGMPDTLEYLNLTEAFPRLHIDTTMALSNASPLHSDIESAVVEVHAKHILYGSDHPNLPHPYEEEGAALEALGLSEKAKQLIFAENARRLLSAHL